MCGRFALKSTLDQLAQIFGAQAAHQTSSQAPSQTSHHISEGERWDWAGSYNISPASVIPVLAFDGQKRKKLVPMRWGLHPHWKRTRPEGRPLFNARLETAREKASFRTPYQKRRALIPVSGWYEWEGVSKPKTPYYIYEKNTPIFAFAGLWDQWRVEEGITLLSCTVLTTSATAPIDHLHHRMPVRLPRAAWEGWLDPDQKAKEVLAQAGEAPELAYHAVGRDINSGQARGAELIERIS